MRGIVAWRHWMGLASALAPAVCTDVAAARDAGGMLHVIWFVARTARVAMRRGAGAAVVLSPFRERGRRR